uniref:Uncharacterized protein n=1 Tax=Ditylenchus dipsaci TaxID=166011 RepID=A0A915EUU6_9BILA
MIIDPEQVLTGAFNDLQIVLEHRKNSKEKFYASLGAMLRKRLKNAMPKFSTMLPMVSILNIWKNLS